MADDQYDREFWEKRWEQAIREHPDAIANRSPNRHFLDIIPDLNAGRALDAGCGHGAETLWLASHGWRVTAVDFAAIALEQGQLSAENLGTDIAERIEWAEADLGVWTPAPMQFDLVLSLYVHVAGSMREMVQRLASGVAHGGTLLLVGHRPVDPATGAPSAAAGQTQVSVDEAVEALNPNEWKFLTAEELNRTALGTGIDAVVRAVRS
jgi:2-polyprenyl-3-methyl-5-hydroxy-6-metoxy-1,4-benzoquinol methylase